MLGKKIIWNVMYIGYVYLNRVEKYFKNYGLILFYKIGI